MSRAIFDKKYHPLLFHPQYVNIPKKEPGIHIARFFHRSSFRMIRYLFFLLSLNSISCTTANNDRCCKDSNPYADRCIIAGLYRTSCCTAGIVRSSSARCTIIRDRSDPIISTMICSRCNSRNRCRLRRKTVGDLLCYRKEERYPADFLLRSCLFPDRSFSCIHSADTKRQSRHNIISNI